MLSIFQGRKPQVPPLFALGTLKLSEKVHCLASKSLIDPLPYVQRHVRGDWGEASEAECQMHDVEQEPGDRKSVGEGKRVSIRVDNGGRRIIIKNIKLHLTQ